MVYLAISKDNQTTPIQQTDPEGVPLFSKYVEQLQAGRDGHARRRGPRPSGRQPRDIPAGEYWVQPFVNVYTRFPRADGHTVWMHMDQWEGQNWKRSPGNLYGDPVKMRIDPASPAPIKLVADKVIPPITPPADTDMVKRIKIQSQVLTKWWGQPIFLGATILLPKDYDKHPDVKLPDQLHPGALLARRARRLRPRRRVRQAVARGGHAARSSTSRCSIRRRTTTTRTR